MALPSHYRPDISQCSLAIFVWPRSRARLLVYVGPRNCSACMGISSHDRKESDCGLQRYITYPGCLRSRPFPGHSPRQPFFCRLQETEPDLLVPATELSDSVEIRFMTTVATVISELSNPHRVVPLLRDLARCYCRAHALAADLACVTAVLTWAMERTHGASFTADIRSAWQAACGMLVADLVAPAPPAVAETDVGWVINSRHAPNSEVGRNWARVVAHTGAGASIDFLVENPSSVATNDNSRAVMHRGRSQ